MEWYLQAWRNWNNFEGRARRKEYWMFVLFFYLFIIVGSFVAEFFGDGIIAKVIRGLLVLAILVHIVPGLAVAVRRLHDSGNSGWWLLIGIIPLIGPIVLLVFYCTDSVRGQNKWGPNPKEVNPENPGPGSLEGVLDDIF